MPVETLKGPNGWTITKASLQEYLELAIHGKPAYQGHRSSRSNGREDWAGTASWQEAVQLIETGWEEGRNRIGDILTSLEGTVRDVLKPKVVWDVEGDCCDIARYVEGEPECMMRWTPRPSKKRVAKVFADIGASCGVSAEALRWRGACVLALVDKLENSGIRVELDFGRGMDRSWVEVIHIKDADDPLYMDTLGFHLAHPSAFRRVMFSFEETQAEGGKHGCQGGWYGSPTMDLTDALKDEGYDLIVPGFQLHDLDAAIKKVEGMFNQVCDAERLYHGEY
jgi:hypothetical protein